MLTPGDRAMIEEVLGAPGPVKRRAVARTITLVESTLPDDRARADDVLDALLPESGRSFRLGVSGAPGAGKSTFIEAAGLRLVGEDHRVAVLAVDPSSRVSGGSILGDKTRMDRLSADERAFIRPSPSSGTLGGVADRTRETILIVEAAGYDVVIVETVGVGQSEIAVAGMTDMFVLLQLPNAGDDLQAIKMGVTEIADLIVVNKADLDEAAAERARGQIASSLRLLGLHGRPDDAPEDGGVRSPRVLQVSALTGQGMDAFHEEMERFRETETAAGRLADRRRRQAEAWMTERLEAGLRERFGSHPGVRAALPGIVEDVREGRVAASVAARRLLDLVDHGPGVCLP